MGQNLNKETEFGSPGNRNLSPGRDKTEPLRVGGRKTVPTKAFVESLFFKCWGSSPGPCACWASLFDWDTPSPFCVKLFGLCLLKFEISIFSVWEVTIQVDVCILSRHANRWQCLEQSGTENYGLGSRKFWTWACPLCDWSESSRLLGSLWYVKVGLESLGTLLSLEIFWTPQELCEIIPLGSILAVWSSLCSEPQLASETDAIFSVSCHCCT